MMGAGKSTVGRKLARRLRLRFVDADAEIEAAAGASVAEIFAREGEAGFRARERAAVEALEGQAAVVALGGGAFVQAEVRARLAGSGGVVYLRARPETLLERIGEAEERPLLAGLGRAERLARIRELLEEREPAYAAADLCLDTDGRAVEEIVESIVRGLSASGSRVDAAEET
jgi:shikimate kinase